MSAIAYSRFRKNPGQVIEEMFDADEPVTVTRADGRDFVMVPRDEWESWMETLYLLGSKKNAEHLRESTREIERGEMVNIKDLR